MTDAVEPTVNFRGEKNPWGNRGSALGEPAIMSRIKFPRQQGYGDWDDEGPVNFVDLKLMQYNSCVAFVEQPGGPSQWYCSAAVVNAGHHLNKHPNWTWEMAEVFELSKAVDAFVTWTEMTAQSFASGKWASMVPIGILAT